MATAATKLWMLKQNQPSTSQITGASVWNQRQVFFLNGWIDLNALSELCFFSFFLFNFGLVFKVLIYNL